VSESNSKFIQLKLKTDHAELLTGLDALLRLGLVSDAQVRQWGRSQLSCRLPDPIVITETVTQKPIEEPVFVLKIPAVPTILSRFLDELSVRWLLFLGVFLVVLSSGVLVASQWSNFPAVGQYLVLWSYTLVFGFVGFWAAGQPELKLTSQTLQTVAMLLVLLNFWAVDELNIWQSIWQSGVAIAAIVLLSLGVRLFANNRHWSKPMFGGFLALGLVHWGWDSVLNPVAGVYLGIGIVIVILWGMPLFAKRSHPQKVPESVEDRLGLEFVLFGLGLLLFRAIAVAGVPIGALGLGLGALGWLLTELERDKIRQFSTDSNPQTSTEAIAHPWEAAGASLLLLGWLVTVGRYDWQVLGVSALAVAWILQKLRRDWLVVDLVALFVVGLQGGILCRNVIPLGLKTSVTTAAVEFSQAQAFPYAIYSVTLLPYLLIWAIAAVWFYRQNKQELARTSEYLLLGLGVILAGLSLPNPTWRSLNFTISAGVWFYFTTYSRPYLRRNYLYLSHGMALLALGGIIERIFPNLGLVIWGIICLVAVPIEWGFCLLSTTNKDYQAWQKSSWHYGLCLAIASFILLIIAPLEMGSNIRLIWLIAPSAATFLALKKKKIWRREALQFSILGLIVLPLFGATTNGMEGITTVVVQTNVESVLFFLQICLAIATGLMFVNVRLMPAKIVAHLHIAFGTAFIISLVYLKITDWQWLILGSIGSGIFWGFAAILQPKRRYLGQLYRKICHQWGLVCAGFVALALLQNSLETWGKIGYYWAENVHPEILVSGGLLFIITLTKYWKNPQNEALVIGGITLETVVIETCLLSGANPVEIAIRNLCLATIFFYTQKKIDQLQQCSLWQAYPLLFTFLSFAWRVGSFNAFTGLLMIYLGLLFFACATLYQKIGFLRFLGFASITFGFYETVIYQMLRSSGGNASDGFTILAFVAIGLALIYRSLYWLRSAKGYEQIASIPLKEILIAAHIHWAIAAIFKLCTLPYFQTEPPNLKVMAIAINICLAIYAFIQANNQTQKTTSKWSEWWIYVGAIELIVTSIQARWMWQQLETIDPFRVLLVSLLALMIFQLPWTNMGWQEAPWHRVGIAMPALCLVMTTSPEVSYLSLASVTLVYLRLAQLQKNVRWGYISLIFGNWLIGKILFQFDLIQPLSYALQVGLSILLIAQIDPDFQAGKGRSLRHLLRLIGSGIICVIALINYQEFGITPAIISLVFIFLGLGLQIRAFLYNGTIILIMTGIYQLVILIDNYSFTKWVIGLIAGILLISIAANFEQRRLQIMKILQNWVETFNNWQ
jgi:hypothetical protein